MEIPKEQQEFIKQAIVDTVRSMNVMEANMTAGYDEIENDGINKCYKSNGTLEIYVKLSTNQEDKK